MSLKCVVIDDEPLARECIVNYTREVNFLELAGTGNSPVELSRLLEENNIDLVFLDIHMPVMNGIDYLKMMSNMPMVIITTAYPSYALEGFQLDVLDYLVKPITFNRFFKAVTKARDHHQLLQRSAQSRPGTDSIAADHFFIKCDYKYERIYFDEILFIEAMQNYVTIHTTKNKYITLLYMKNVEQNLSGNDFIRIHKSYIVAVSKIESIENSEVIIRSHRIPISRNYRDQVIERVVNNRLWKNPGRTET